MGIVRKKKGITNKNMLGGSPKASYTIASKEVPGATKRTGKKAYKVVKTIGKGVGYAVAAPVVVPVVASVAVPYALAKHGIKIAATSAAIGTGIVTGAVAGVGTLGAAGLKTLYKAPVYGVQALRSKIAHKKLTKKLGGLDMSESTRKLNKYLSEKQSLNSSHKQKISAIQSKMNIATKPNDVAKHAKEIEKIKKSYEEKQGKLLKRIVATSTNNKKRFGNVTIQNANKTNISKISSILNASKKSLQNTYNKKKAEFDNVVAQKRLDRGIEAKKTELDLKKDTLKTEITESQKKLVSSQSALKEKQTALNNHIATKNTNPNPDSVAYNMKRIRLQNEIKAAEKQHALAIKTHANEQLEFKKREKAHINEDAKIQLLEPKSLSYYEGEYLKRKQAKLKARSSLTRDYRQIPQRIVNSFGKGAKLIEKTGLVYNSNAFKPQILQKLGVIKKNNSSTKTKPSTLSGKTIAYSKTLKPEEIEKNNGLKSQFTTTERYLNAGVKGFTSTQRKVEKFRDILYGTYDDKGVKTNSTQTKERKNFKQINESIAEIQKKIDTMDKTINYNEYVKLQKDINQLNKDKKSRIKIMREAQKDILDATDPVKFIEYKKNLEPLIVTGSKSQKYANINNFKTNIQNTLNDQTTNNDYKVQELDKIGINFANEMKKFPNDLELLNNYRDIRRLIKYHQALDLKEEIVNELKPEVNS